MSLINISNAFGIILFLSLDCSNYFTNIFVLIDKWLGVVPRETETVPLWKSLINLCSIKAHIAL